MIASGPDLLRLLVVPAFGWAAYRDFRTRRLPNHLWPPLIAIGLLALAWESWTRLPLSGVADRLFFIQVGISLFFVAPLGYLFWRIGGFGGADAKALISLAAVYPTYPTYGLAVAWLPTVPIVTSNVGVFSLTILTNTVLLGIAYPIALAVRNLLDGRICPVMFLARPVSVESVPDRHGRLFETREGYTRRGLDLDALRMYLRWRGLDLEELRDRPDALRDPDSVRETFDATDGAVTAGPAGGLTTTDGGAPDGEKTGDAERTHAEDAWAARRFREEVGPAYGTTPEMLREGIETLLRRETVWVSPGLPFVVPMFFGLVVAVAYGDLLFAAMRALGLV
ncbi:MAG: prepilin peptidase [Haloferacaceae archaeon]